MKRLSTFCEPFSNHCSFVSFIEEGFDRPGLETLAENIFASFSPQTKAEKTRLHCWSAQSRE